MFNSVSFPVVKTRLIFVFLVIAFIALMQLPWQWSGQASLALADQPAVAPGALMPGLVLCLQDRTGKTLDAHDARLIALFVPAGQTVSPLMPAGPFSATWTGLLTNRIKDTCTFAAEGRGDLTVTLNDKPVLQLHGDFANHPADPAVIKKGKNKLVVVYHAPADGDATVRLFWAASGKPLEPVCATTKQMQLVHDSADPLIAAHQSVRQGRELLASMRCMACHQGITSSMPESQQDAPNLLDLKNRLNPTWATYWISNPKALRPSASMPCLFHDGPASDQPTVDDRAGDIAAYLCGHPEQPEPVEIPVSTPGEMARGARLFTGLGCVGCHVAPGVTDSDPTLNRVPLQYVRAKYKPDALRTFLKKPEAHYAWIKMPNFHMTDVEASALSVWLLGSCKADALAPIAKKFDADNGKKLFDSMGCMNCHAVGKTQTVMPAASDFAHADFKKGCLSDDRSQIQKGVDFQFSAEQIAAIRVFISTDWKADLQRDTPAEFATRQIAAVRCNACHSLDGVDSVWANMDTEVSAIEKDLPPRAENEPEPKGDQSRPPLTWMGEKLRPTWMASFIAGEIPYKPRTWLFARMPSFASRAYLLTKGMAMTHGCSGVDEVRPPADPKLADIGKSLTSQAGLGCVKCHAVADQAAIAPFEAEAPNLAHVDARLRHDYFTHWMRDPQYFLPGTKMPSFANVDGQTPLKEVLGGDAAAEYEAIWNYLRAGEKIEPVQ
jgi:cytochrome c551/c552